MNEAHERFETELASLRPHDASQELRQRIADHRTKVLAPIIRWRWRLTFATGLAAACLAVILLWLGSERRIGPKEIVVQSHPLVPNQAQALEPTLLEYQRALACSPEELDALFDKYALLTSEPHPELARIGPVTRSDASLHALLGED